ncbi:MAG: Uma2 family endonuclease, partial [Cyanobacteria bacterium J06607_13]
FWENQKFSLYSLIDSETGYEAIESSRLLPTLDLVLLTQFIDQPSQTKAVKAFRKALRDSLPDSTSSS